MSADLDYDEDHGYDYEPDEYEEAMANCCGHFEGGVFVCGAVGSEDCDFDCPFNRDLDLTMKEIEQRDVEEMLAEARAVREAKGASEYDSWGSVDRTTKANG